MTVRPRALVALDHRRLFVRMCEAARIEPVDQHGLVVQLKTAVIDAVTELLAAEPHHAQVLGVLLDEEYGAALSIEVKRIGLPLALAVERNEASCFTLEYGGDWTRHVVAFGPDLVKVLVRLDPSGPNRELALERLDSVAAWCRTHDQDLLVELIPTAEHRGQLAHAVSSLVDRGLAPAMWKLPAPSTRVEVGAVVAATRRATVEPTGVVFLGGGGAREDIVESLARCLDTDGVTGWAVGRALWYEPLMAMLEGRITRDQAVDQVAENLRVLLQLLPGHGR